jgi:hypothetical protein
VAAVSPLPVWCCGNPACPVVRRGKPRVLFSGHLAAGTIVEAPACRVCHWITRVAIDAAGRPEISCRPGSVSTRQEVGHGIG